MCLLRKLSAENDQKCIRRVCYRQPFCPYLQKPRKQQQKNTQKHISIICLKIENTLNFIT